MSNTYTQIHIHAIFAVRNREALIAPEWRDNLYKYMNTIITDAGHKTLAIGGTENHVHIFFGYRPAQPLPSLILRIKRETSEWINKKGFSKYRFQWQEGYGAFSHSKSHVSSVIKYILNQESHHKKRSFREEYLDILRKNEVIFDDRYIFDDI